MIFKDLVKIKNKRKIKKPLPPHPKTAQGGYLNGFVSPRRLNGWFYCPERKNRFGSKLREVKKTFSPLKLQPSKSNWAKISRGSGTNHAFLLSRHESIFLIEKIEKKKRKHESFLVRCFRASSDAMAANDLGLSKTLFR